MTREEVLESAAKIIKDCFPELANETFTEDTKLSDYENIDSMGYVLIITKLEGIFDSRIPEEKWNSLTSMKELIDAVIEYKQ